MRWDCLREERREISEREGGRLEDAREVRNWVTWAGGRGRAEEVWESASRDRNDASINCFCGFSSLLKELRQRKRTRHRSMRALKRW